MKKVLDSTSQAGLKDMNEPRLFKDRFPHTELGVDVKFLTYKPGRLPIGETLAGLVNRDSDTHITITESAATDLSKVPQKRNPKPYDGVFLSYTQHDDNTYRLNFKDFEIGPTLTMKELRKMANSIRKEIIYGYPGLVEKEEVQ